MDNKENFTKFNSIRSQTRSSASIFEMFHNLQSNDLLEKIEKEPNLAEFKNLIEKNRNSFKNFSPNTKNTTTLDTATSSNASIDNSNNNCMENFINIDGITDNNLMFDDLFSKEAKFKSPKAYFKIVYSATKIW